MKNLKNRVGISMRVEFIEKFNEKRDTLSQDWIKFIQNNNSKPILIPNTLSNVSQFLAEMKLDSIINTNMIRLWWNLNGGNNIKSFKCIK